nr:PREDICTED: leucine-rich repeat and IQ domain-containing protein 4-like [Linepithema humile]
MQAPIRNNLKRLDISHNYITKFPLQITCLKNLQLLDVRRNKIDFLPKELGTLPNLMYLNLSSNHLGKSNRKAWEWLEQTEVRNKLSDLCLSDNLLTELPPQIGKLNALTILLLTNNKLKCLPQSLANLRNLIFLDLLDNKLLYLPGNIAHLSATISVDGNPFNLIIIGDNDDDSNDDSDDDSGDDFTAYLEVPSLVDCSAEVILENGLDYTNDELSEEMVKYMDNKRHCFICNNPCFRYYDKFFVNYLNYCFIWGFQLNASRNIMNASFECYVCSSNCAERLRLF